MRGTDCGLLGDRPQRVEVFVAVEHLFRVCVRACVLVCRCCARLLFLFKSVPCCCFGAFTLFTLLFQLKLQPFVVFLLLLFKTYMHNFPQATTPSHLTIQSIRLRPLLLALRRQLIFIQR